MVIPDLLLENKYLLSLSILVVFYIVSRLMVFIVDKIILKLASKTQTNIDDLIIEKTKHPVSLLLLLIGIRLAFLPFNLSETTVSAISHVTLTFVVLIIGYIFMRVFDVLIDNWAKNFAKKTKSIVDDALLSLFHRFSKIVMVALILLYILNVWGVQVGPLLASLGVAGLAIALALQNTLSNIFGGVTLLIDKSVKVGDRIKLDSGQSGIVMDVGLRSTRIRTWSNDIIVVPNGMLSNSKVENFVTGDRKARVEVNFGVAYGSNINHVEKVVLKAVSKIKACLKKPAPAVDFLEMGDSALLMRAKFWVEDVDIRYKSQLKATKEIYNALNKEKIVIPFPQMDVHLYKE